jgi:predicted TIM-barrel fold metal-dependent hydrolase
MAPGRRLGVAVVPATWNVDEAVREVRWARQNGLGSIMIPVLWGPHAPYHHPKYDPLWAVCQDLDVVIHFHSGPAPAEEYFGTPGEAPLVGGMGIFACEAVWAVVRPLTFFIWGGVFERYPKLKVVVTEATTTWAPSFLEHLDDRYNDWHVTAKLGNYRRHLSMKPSDYFHRNIRLGTFFGRREAERRHEVGLQCMMWGSDYPHPEGTWPQTERQLVDAFRGLPEDEVAVMLGGSAAEFYGVDVEKLAPLAARIGPEKRLLRA